VGTEIEISAEIKTGRQIKLALKSIFDIWSIQKIHGR
jgi:hypothetical protein